MLYTIIQYSGIACGIKSFEIILQRRLVNICRNMFCSQTIIGKKQEETITDVIQNKHFCCAPQDFNWKLLSMIEGREILAKPKNNKIYFVLLYPFECATYSANTPFFPQCCNFFN